MPPLNHVLHEDFTTIKLENMLLVLTLLVLAISLLAGVDRFSEQDPKLLNDIKIISNSPDVEKWLSPYKDLIGNDYDGYRNHIYRTLTFALHFLQGEEKSYRPLIEAALVFHDIGLWTDSELAYLEPSSALARRKLAAAGISGDDLELIHNIIYWHHKLTPFVGPHENIVNAVRKADWIDASLGIVTKGMPTEHIAKVKAALPNAGFHQALASFMTRIHGLAPWNVLKSVFEISSIFKF